MDKLRRMGAFQVERRAPRKGRKQVAPGQMPASFIQQPFIKHLLCTCLEQACWSQASRRKSQPGRYLGAGMAARPWRFHPMVPSTQLMIGGEEPLLWRNHKEVVNGGTRVPGPRGQKLTSGSRGEEGSRGRGQAEKITLAWEWTQKEKGFPALKCNLSLLHTGF